MALAAAGPGKGHQDCQDEGGSPSRAARGRKTEARAVGEFRRRLVLAGQGNRWVGGEGEEKEGKGKENAGHTQL
jgi:hypothetical protein